VVTDPDRHKACGSSPEPAGSKSERTGTLRIQCTGTNQERKDLKARYPYSLTSYQVLNGSNQSHTHTHTHVYSLNV